MGLFDIANYTLRFLTIPMAMVGMTIFGFGVWILTINRYDRSHRDFFALCSCLAGWLIGEALGSSTIRPQDTAAISRLIWSVVLFLPPATFALYAGILGYQKLRERLAPALFIVALAFLPTVLTEGFMSSTQAVNHAWTIVLMSGPINFIYFGFFVAVFASVLFLNWRRMRDPGLMPHERRLVRLVFAATIVGCFGVVDWLQSFGLPVPIVGFLPILVWITLFAYAIFRYRLFQMTLAVAGPTIIEALPGALFVTGLGGEIVIVNPGALAMTGQTEPALLGRGIRDFLPAAGQTLECALQAVKPEDCQIHRLETDFLAEKRKFPVTLSARVIRRPDGVPNGAIFIAVEISRLKEQAEQAEQRKEELKRLVAEMQRTQKMLAGREARLKELEEEAKLLKSNHV